ncbi:MAG: 3-deoxy-manno-octulosonate cytidylyltransferase [Alphaproteobacteria bacterium]|nr:3-deoxy-manno-octulosonate cytidylyltransferase [Alphaproteobacteria bacterium]
MQKINPIILIPARLGATRLPNKPMADIVGKTMIEHVYRRGVESGLGPVYVATPDQEIIDVIKKMGGNAILTSINHQTGSDRIYEAIQKIDPDKKYNVIVNLQGDLPLIKPENLKKVVDPLLADAQVDIATIAAPITEASDKTNINVVKIALELSAKNPDIGRGVYFSRSLIPQTPNDDDVYYHHIGVYAFRREALERFMTLPVSLLEKRERLEQLRALASGMRIDVALVDQIPQSVDTQEDLDRVRAQATNI